MSSDDLGLPVNYDKLDWKERRRVREKYIKHQQGLCHYCKNPLDSMPTPEVLRKKVTPRLYPDGFFDNPTHLHHCRQTGMTKGDFHTAVWKTIDKYVHSRDNTKNVEYALFYGASDYKLGTMADWKPSKWDEKRTGKEIRKLIMSGLPSLGSLDERVRKASERGYLIGLDGRRIMMRRN